MVPASLPPTKESMAFRAIFPINIMTLVLVGAKLFGFLSITWMQALSPGMALAIILGLMAEYGLWICHQEEKEFLRKDQF